MKVTTAPLGPVASISALAGVPAIGAIRSRSSSTAVDPHIPHAEVVAVSRGVVSGAAPPVSTLTTLKLLSTALPVVHGTA